MIATGVFAYIFMSLLTVMTIHMGIAFSAVCRADHGAIIQIIAFRIYGFDALVLRFSVSFAISVIRLLRKILGIFWRNTKVSFQCHSRQNTTHPRVCGLKYPLEWIFQTSTDLKARLTAGIVVRPHSGQMPSLLPQQYLEILQGRRGFGTLDRYSLRSGC